MFFEFLPIAAKGLVHRKLRSWLTMLGIFIGVAAIVSLIALGTGLREAIIAQLSFVGSDMIIVSPGGLAGPPGSETGSSKLYERDLEAVQKIGGVRVAAGFLSRTLRVGTDREEISALVFGIPTDETRILFDELSAFDVETGRKIRSGDAAKAVIGYDLAHARVFERELHIGQKIFIAGKPHEIVGVRQKIGNPIFDKQILVSLERMRELTGLPEEISGVRARPEKGVDASDLSLVIARRLRNTRDVRAGEEDFRIQTSEQVLDTIGTILLVVQMVVSGIAAVSLVVGGVGILNTMYTSVLERTQQIGVMKAIGARNHDIFVLFFVESGLLGTVGGLVGILLGIGLARLAAFGGHVYLGTDLIRAKFSMSLILGALLFSFVVGCVSGVLPALSAARQNPVDALRYE